MSQIVVLSQKDLAAMLDLNTALAGVQTALMHKSTRKAALVPMQYHAFDAAADMDIKAGHLSAGGVYGLKLVSWFGQNPARGLPALRGTTLLFDDTTGQPLALLNAAELSLLHAGAAAAVGAKYLANPGSTTLLVVGTGAQAAYQIAATLLAMPGLQQVLLYNPHGAEKAALRLPAIAEQTQRLLAACGSALTVPVLPVQTDAELPQAVAQSQIIITATPSTRALLQAGWIRPGTHISCMGADVKGKQELDPMILKNGRVFADDIDQAIRVGECQTAINRGVMFQTQIAGELGAVIAGTLAGRMSPEQITVFDSTGLALQDLTAAKAAYDQALATGAGTRVEL